MTYRDLSGAEITEEEGLALLADPKRLVVCEFRHNRRTRARVEHLVKDDGHGGFFRVSVLDARGELASTTTANTLGLAKELFKLTVSALRERLE